LIAAVAEENYDRSDSGAERRARRRRCDVLHGEGEAADEL